MSVGPVAGYPFQHYNLGFQRRGSVVVVTLAGNRANVRLMDGANFSSYQRGAQYQAMGGQAQSSPVRLSVPSDGNWHLVVDLIGLGGTVRSGVRVELPPSGAVASSA